MGVLGCVLIVARVGSIAGGWPREAPECGKAYRERRTKPHKDGCPGRLEVTVPGGSSHDAANVQICTIHRRWQEQVPAEQGPLQGG